jgi:PBP1b-binding outer membrane lipoprotein LpoB
MQVPAARPLQARGWAMKNVLIAVSCLIILCSCNESKNHKQESIEPAKSNNLLDINKNNLKYIKDMILQDAVDGLFENGVVFNEGKSKNLFNIADVITS